MYSRPGFTSNVTVRYGEPVPQTWMLVEFRAESDLSEQPAVRRATSTGFGKHGHVWRIGALAALAFRLQDKALRLPVLNPEMCIFAAQGPHRGGNVN